MGLSMQSSRASAQPATGQQLPRRGKHVLAAVVAAGIRPSTCAFWCASCSSLAFEVLPRCADLLLLRWGEYACSTCTLSRVCQIGICCCAMLTSCCCAGVYMLAVPAFCQGFVRLASSAVLTCCCCAGVYACSACMLPRVWPIGFCCCAELLLLCCG
jgi:hypothetical protein